MAAARVLPVRTHPEWTVEKLNPGVFRINYDWAGQGVDFNARVLIMSDEHWDNAHCDRALLKRHHEEALACNAPILKFGDTLCLMQGKWDKRSDTHELRPEHAGNNYLDLVSDTAVDWYAPYGKNIAIISPGNHEDSITKRHQTDMTERLVNGLRRTGSPVLKAPFQGFVIFKFNGNGRTFSRTLCYHHGYGGGGEVTRGMIDNNRTRSQYEADIYYSGHIHRLNADWNTKVCISQNAIVEREEIFLRGASYKKDYDGGWQISRGQAARPRGGWWLTFKIRSSNGYELGVSAERAS